ncbi:MAG TPA: Uma2 family endonuclease [Tepidisphaeraceae bacterium]|nr:Uma2 family endonuclease [Tepidisphaeraceae bacterium]
MTVQSPHSRRFVPGTTGWTEEDLYDPQIERLWERGRYEIIEGVLTKMPAAYLEGSFPLKRLVHQVEDYLKQAGKSGEFGFELDLVVNNIRVPRVDAIFVTPEQLRKQEQAQARRKPRSKLRYGRLRIVPELVIESVSPGHELHDHRTKREWYRQFGIPNYWIFDAHRKSLECLRLVEGVYQTDVIGNDQEEIAPGMFPGLTIRLASIWM